MSVALPLPSSPHCAPTITMAGMSQGPSRNRTKAPASVIAVRHASAAGALAFRCYRKCARCTWRLAAGRGSRLEGGYGCSAAVGEELLAAPRLVVLADGRGRNAEHVERAQEPLVGLVLPGNRAVPGPACPAQLVEAPVVAGPGKRVRGDRMADRHRVLGQRCPGGAVARESGRDLG